MCVYVCVCVCKQTCMCLSVFVSVCKCLCTCVCLCVCMCNSVVCQISWHVCQMSQKVQNVKMVSLSVCACVCVHLYFSVCVYGVPFKNLVSLTCMPNKPKSAKCNISLKIHNFKNTNDRCIISSLWVDPVWMHNCAKYEGSNLNHVDRRAT